MPPLCQLINADILLSPSSRTRRRRRSEVSDEGEKSEKMEENGLREFLAQDEFLVGKMQERQRKIMVQDLD